jgi:hypothetical protein
MAKKKEVFHVEQDLKPNEMHEPIVVRRNLFDEEIWAELGQYRTTLVKRKLDGQSVKKLTALLLVEWAQGRVRL